MRKMYKKFYRTINTSIFSLKSDLFNWVCKSWNLYNRCPTEIVAKHRRINCGTHDNQLQFWVCFTSSPQQVHQ